jgi:hypothetical protein
MSPAGTDQSKEALVANPDQLSLFASAPRHPDARPLVTHYPPTYPGEIDYLWHSIRPSCPGCRIPMHLDRIHRLPGGWRGLFTCEECGGRADACQ